MCGIVGYLTKNFTPTSSGVMARMLDASAHRGPDQSGIFSDPRVKLGMARLKINDLSTGSQPIFNEDKSILVICNGEIYNHKELVDELVDRGHLFKGASDVEVIVHLYEEFGIDCVHKLRGMFAFAVYDINRGKVYLARDRMGEKPLYFHRSQNTLIFASELKALVHSGVVAFELEPSSINEYFHYQYVPEPRTPLRSVAKLPKASYIEVSLDDWKISHKEYWRMEDAAPVYGDATSLIRKCLEEYFPLVLRSDVPVGVALSGGLDSGAIACLGSKYYKGHLKAFSVGYPGRPKCDERAEAKALAEQLNIELTEIEIASSDVANAFEELSLMRDDPIADISGYSYYCLSRTSKAQGVPVLLTGQGSDEMFWGYGWVREAALAVKGINDPKVRDARASSTFEYTLLLHEFAPDFSIAMSELKHLFTSEFKSSLEGSDARALYRNQPSKIAPELAITKSICDTYLLGNGLAQADRLGMANSVEVRSPFVDHVLVDLITGLRKASNIYPDYELEPKTWLKSAMRGIVPDEVLAREKRGFAPPTKEWHDAIFALHGTKLIDGVLVKHKILSEDAARKLSGGEFTQGAICPISFKALVLEIWCRQISAIIEKSKPHIKVEA